jgi:hypothetical protein
MNTGTLLRIGAGAAMLAGVLRAASSFALGGSEVVRQSLYLVIDLLLLLGLFTAYAQNHEALRLAVFFVASGVIFGAAMVGVGYQVLLGVRTRVP